MPDVVIQAQSTEFARQGSTVQYRGYTMPTSLYNAIISNYLNSILASSLSTDVQNALAHLLQQDSEVIPGGLTLYDIQNLDPTLFEGAAELEQIYQQDPFSTEFEDETEDLYDRTYEKARATAQSGPLNIRGGTARQGFELAELDTLQSINRFREIWNARMSTANLVVQATQVANAIETARRGLMLQAQQQQAATEQGRVMQTLSAAEQLTRDREAHVRSLAAGGEFLSVPKMTTVESVAGRGFQGAVNTSFGMTTWR